MNSNNPDFPRSETPHRHGLSKLPEYAAWTAMKARCNNPKGPAYKNYGGRGIRVCERWLNSFENFLADMGRRPTPEYSLDRENNNGNYEPANCRWATQIEQANNLRTNRLITFNGKTQTLTNWARERGLSEGVLRSRLDLGWSIKRSLTEVTNASRPFADALRRSGLAKSTFRNRLKRGWDIEKIVSTPVQKPGKSRLTDSEVEQIRTLRKQGQTMQQIADKFNSCTSHISRILHGTRRAIT